MAAPGGATALRRSTRGRSGPSPAKDDRLQKIRLAAFELVMDVHLPPTHRYSTAVKEFYCSAHGLDFEQVRTNMNYWINKLVKESNIVVQSADVRALRVERRAAVIVRTSPSGKQRFVARPQV